MSVTFCVFFFSLPSFHFSCKFYLYLVNETSLSVFNLVPMESSSNEQKGDSTAAIAASVVVVLLLVGVAFIVGVIFWRR